MIRTSVHHNFTIKVVKEVEGVDTIEREVVKIDEYNTENAREKFAKLYRGIKPCKVERVEVVREMSDEDWAKYATITGEKSTEV